MSDTQSAPANGAATNGSVQFRDAPVEGINSADRNALLKAASDAMRASEAKSEAAAKAAAPVTPVTPVTPASTEEPAPAAAAADPEPAEETEQLADETPPEKVEPVKAAPVVADKPDPAANMRRLLKLKEQEQTERERIESDGRQLREQATQEARKIVDDAKAEAQRYVRQMLDGLRGRPIDAARELGFDLDQVIAQKADEQDPNVQMRKWLEGELGGIKKTIEEQAARNKALEERNDVWQRQAAEAANNGARERFLSQAQGDEYEFARELWTPAELIAKAKDVIAQVQVASEREGKRYSPPNAEVLAYLNEQAQEHLKAKAPSWAKLLQKVGAVAVADAPTQDPAKAETPKQAPKSNASGKAPAGQGQGPRTLSAQATSERRAPPKATDNELSENEFRKLAMATAGEFLRPK